MIRLGALLAIGRGTVGMRQMSGTSRDDAKESSTHQALGAYFARTFLRFGLPGVSSSCLPYGDDSRSILTAACCRREREKSRAEGWKPFGTNRPDADQVRDHPLLITPWTYHGI
jgi:hypothetical protein